MLVLVLVVTLTTIVIVVGIGPFDADPVQPSLDLLDEALV